ncbi:DUF6036 family nucleotidyltransferase [Pseudomonas aeruginosa]|uniref:DUF6036 family nucleotidyltransferase n=1 Tax=Pseudomonas aeruginosa TaxID=287 RepID=UPI0022B632C4|nr:DUF6036 family nucleotidyltransferase [Pseudomonas aeruginosa]MCZ7803424.1 DUF6036 family nucleotidyltransferase [Pseudomonas aeruginosa]
MSNIQLSTPLGEAVARLFSRALPLLEGQAPGAVKVFIFGGCGVHLLTHARGSADIDAEVEAARILRRDELVAVLADPEFYEQGDEDLTVEFDPNYNTSLGPLHEDYRDRAIPLDGFDGNQPLHVYVAAGVDLAISKLSRFTEQDKADIEALIDSGRVDVEEFVTLATEAIDYAVGNRSGMLSCLADVTEPYLEDGHYGSPKP